MSNSLLLLKETCVINLSHLIYIWLSLHLEVNILSSVDGVNENRIFESVVPNNIFQTCYNKQ